MLAARAKEELHYGLVQTELVQGPRASTVVPVQAAQGQEIWLLGLLCPRYSNNHCYQERES